MNTRIFKLINFFFPLVSRLTVFRLSSFVGLDSTTSAI